MTVPQRLCPGFSSTRQTDVPNQNEFDDRLLKIASEYKSYGRVDDETRWAPWLCRMPLPSQVRFSQSEDEESHGKKLYYLFARDRRAYMDSSKSDEQTGQVVVKESWHPIKSNQELTTMRDDSETDPITDRSDNESNSVKESSIAGLVFGGSSYPFARKGQQLYRTGKKAGLYIMFKTDTNTADTDQGWVYGTVTADGKTVTSSGAVKSCIACHKDAPNDGLFGIQRVPLAK